METRYDVIKFISYHIVNGRGIKIQLDGYILRLEMPKGEPYMIWHDETSHNVAAIIHEVQYSHLDFASEWAKQKVEFYDL